jgi:L-ascorbate metabolism protein UlaG (beta-lactamase superfamily)
MSFAPVREPADIVIRSSSDDLGHCYAEMIPGEPMIVTATEVSTSGMVVRGLRITAIPAHESLIHKDRPGDNAMYCFTLEGIRIAHLGDVGNRLTDEQLAALAGTDVLLAPTGGTQGVPATIELDDLCDAILVLSEAEVNVLQPHIVIPMHYRLPGTKIKMLPVTDFTNRFSSDAVMWIDGSTIELTPTALPAKLRVIVLEPSTI